MTPAGGWTPASAWADAEPDGHWLDTPGCTSPFAPVWIAEIVRRREAGA